MSQSGSPTPSDSWAVDRLISRVTDIIEDLLIVNGWLWRMLLTPNSQTLSQVVGIRDGQEAVEPARGSIENGVLL